MVGIIVRNRRRILFTAAALIAVAGLAGIGPGVRADDQVAEFRSQGKALTAIWLDFAPVGGLGFSNVTVEAAENLEVVGSGAAPGPWGSVEGIIFDADSDTRSTLQASGPLSPGDLRVPNALGRGSLNAVLPGTYEVITPTSYELIPVQVHVKVDLVSVDDDIEIERSRYVRLDPLNGKFVSRYRARASFNTTGTGRIRLTDGVRAIPFLPAKDVDDGILRDVALGIHTVTK